MIAALAQAMFDRGLSILNTDSKNAYNTMSRSRILTSLQQHCPSLVRWFLICHHQEVPLWLSDGTDAGVCDTGVLQGDPLSTLLYCYGFHECLRQVFSVDEVRSSLDNQSNLIRSWYTQSFASENLPWW